MFSASSLQARGWPADYLTRTQSLHFPLEAHVCGYQKTAWFSRSGFSVLFIAKSITLGDTLDWSLLLVLFLTNYVTIGQILDFSGPQ